jgi:predicted RNase H-like nuclease (RuvC/YqgF family)
MFYIIKLGECCMNTNEIRQYNKEVQEYQKKASELLASKDYQQKELLRLCKELSELTGQSVTPENLEAVYQSQMTQFQQTLKTGREIIERAKAEEQSLGGTSSVDASQSQVQSAPVQAAQGAFVQGNEQATTNAQVNQGMAPNIASPFGGQNTGFSPFGNQGAGFNPFAGQGAGQGVGNSPFVQSYDSHGKVGQI